MEYVQRQLRYLVIITSMMAWAMPSTAQDIAIAIDGSGSIDHVYWEKEKQFVIDLVDSFRNVPDTRFSIIKYSSGANTIHSLTDSQDIDDVIAAINSMIYTGGRTATRTAINHSIEQFLYRSDDDREKLHLLITDGVPYPSTENPCDRTEILNQLGVASLILGVGDSWQADTIDCLVEDPERHIIEVGQFDELASYTTLVKGMINTFSHIPENSEAFKLSFNNSDHLLIDLNPDLTGTVEGTASHHAMGAIGGALDINSRYDKINISNPFNTIENTGELTLTTWVKLNSWPEGAEVIGRRGDASKHGTLALMLNNDGKIAFYLHNKHVIPNQTLALNEWTHLALTYNEDNNNIKVYLNGMLVKQDAFNDPSHKSFSTGTDLSLGKGRWNTRTFFDGNLDEVALYNRELSEEEIQSIFDPILR